MINIYYSKDETIRLEKYSNNLRYARLNLSDDKIRELKDLYNRDREEHRLILSSLMYADECEHQRKIEEEQKEQKNAIRREKRRQKKELQLHLEASIKASEERNRIANEKIKKSKKKYKDEKCLSLQVFLEKELVVQFKNKVKQNGMTQAEVLRSFMKDYISKKN